MGKPHEKKERPVTRCWILAQHYFTKVDYVQINIIIITYVLSMISSGLSLMDFQQPHGFLVRS